MNSDWKDKTLSDLIEQVDQLASKNISYLRQIEVADQRLKQASEKVSGLEKEANELRSRLAAGLAGDPDSSGLIKDFENQRAENQKLKDEVSKLRMKNQELEDALVTMTRELGAKSGIRKSQTVEQPRTQINDPFDSENVSTPASSFQMEFDSELDAARGPVTRVDRNQPVEGQGTFEIRKPDTPDADDSFIDQKQLSDEVDEVLGFDDSSRIVLPKPAGGAGVVGQTLSLTIEDRKSGKIVASSEIRSGGTFKIGRLSSNCVPAKFSQFLCKDMVLSGRHLTIHYDDHGVTIRDENSRNGSKVGDETISGSAIVKSPEEVSDLCVRAGQLFVFRLSMSEDNSTGFPSSSMLDLEKSDRESRVVSMVIDEDYLEGLFD